MMHDSFKQEFCVQVVQYAHWLGTDGKPSRRAADAPVHILEEVGSNWSGAGNFFSHIMSTDALRASLVVLSPDAGDLNEEDARTIVNKACTIAFKPPKKPVTPDHFLQIADGIAADHFRRPVNQYSVRTSLSLATFPSRRIRIGEHVITLLSRRAQKKYPYPDAVAMQSPWHRWGKHLASTKYLAISISTSGRTQGEATTKALRALTLTRALWTLGATAKDWRHSFEERSGPLGIIHPGPIHIAYDTNRAPVEDSYWYEPGYVEDASLFKPKAGWEKLERARKIRMSRLRHLPFRREAEDILCRYVQALDQWDLNSSLLQLWSILEHLTGSGTRHEKTVERATWVFSDRPLAHEYLHLLRIRRNRYVHAAHSSAGRDNAVHQLKRFLDPHLLNILKNELRVQTLEDYGRRLELPRSLEALRKRKTEIERMISLVKRWDQPK